jgi:regulator of cell morphogenesis and NO signaling
MLLDGPGVIDPGQPLAQIVLEHPRCARVLVDRDLDFCCRGTMSLAEACAGRGIELDELVSALIEVAAGESSGAAGLDPRSLSNLQLIAHIVDQHHEYLRRTLPLVELLAGRVAEAHAERRPCLEELRFVLRELRILLESHLEREEAVLFPLLLGGARARQRVRDELSWMREEHLHLGDALHTLRALGDRFVPPAWACATYRALLSELEGMDLDTREHVHLENNVLAPRFEHGGPMASGVQRKVGG